MISENVCKFISPSNTVNDLHILHLVHETKRQIFDGWKSLDFYRIHYVFQGKGILHTPNGEYTLNEGDVFFCLPSYPYALQSIDNFRYSYIGFLGDKANEVIHRFKITPKNCVFKNFSFLQSVWLESLKVPNEAAKLYAEGLFSCTIATIATRTMVFDKIRTEANAAPLIKKYIDKNFSSPDLTLESISNALSYTPKYISAIFKKHFNISFKNYLTTIRINNALSLIEKGFIGNNDLSYLCGFNDPMYFSKVFKLKTGQTPNNYISKHINQYKD